MTIRQSCYQAGLTCRRAFKLSQTHESAPSKAMIDGLVFEGFVFGFKDDAKQYAYNKDGSIKAGVKGIQAIAESIKKLFGDGHVHTRLYCEQVNGEPDFIGEFKPVDKMAIVDLKFTKDIAKIWNWKQTKADYFQAVSYTYLQLQETGEMFPFYYLVVANGNEERPIYRIIEMTVTVKDIEWFLGVVNTLNNDKLLIPDTSKCLGTGKFDPACRYLPDCEHGREMMGGFETISFSDLQCDFEIDQVVNEQHKFDSVKQKKQKTFNPDAFEDQGELKESDLSSLEMAPVKMFTAAADQIRDGLLLCRGCETRQAVLEGDKKCPNCNTPIMWV